MYLPVKNIYHLCNTQYVSDTLPRGLFIIANLPSQQPKDTSFCAPFGFEEIDA